MSDSIKYQTSLLKKFCLTTALLMSVSTVAHAEQVLDYKIALAEDGKTYQVSMMPEKAPFADVNLTGQVTIKVPHLDGDNVFRVKNLSSAMEGVTWVETSRVDAPEESPFYDYLSFSLLVTDSQVIRQFGWEAGQEKLMFSFENESGCLEDVALMENDDPFNVEHNSSHTNPGNHFTNLGWGSVSENNYRQNYGDKIVCPQ